MSDSQIKRLKDQLNNDFKLVAGWGSATLFAVASSLVVSTVSPGLALAMAGAGAVAGYATVRCIGDAKGHYAELNEAADRKIAQDFQP